MCKIVFTCNNMNDQNKTMKKKLCTMEFLMIEKKTPLKYGCWTNTSVIDNVLIDHLLYSSAGGWQKKTNLNPSSLTQAENAEIFYTFMILFVNPNNFTEILSKLSILHGFYVCNASLSLMMFY